MSHDQFWSPVTSPSHVRDVQSLFHFSIEPDEDWEVSLQDLRSLGAHDVSEIFSPPRLTEKCRNYGLLPGYAVDLETGWNLLNPNHVKSLERILDEEDPYLVTGSPPCEAFSPLQALNTGRVDPAVRQQRLEEGRRMLKQACEYYNSQGGVGTSYTNIQNQQPVGMKNVSRKFRTYPGHSQLRDQCADGKWRLETPVVNLMSGKTPDGLQIARSWLRFCRAFARTMKELENGIDMSISSMDVPKWHGYTHQNW